MYKPKRRSMQFVPAIKTKFYSRALEGLADTVIFDLDDSIAVSAKDAARQTLLKYFPQNYTGPKELSIRLNHAQSPYFEADLALLQEIQPHSITMTKVETAEEINRVVDQVQAKFTHPVDIFIFIETLPGFYNLAEIFKQVPHVSAATLGTEDLCAGLGIERGRLPDNPLLNRIQIELALQCHQYDVQCIGPVFRGFGDKAQLEALKEEALYLKSMNVRGQLAIHPTQVPVLNQLFDITPQQIAEAKQTLMRFEAMAEKEGTAVISRNNQMEDTPSLIKAQKLIDYAETHGFSMT